MDEKTQEQLNILIANNKDYYAFLEKNELLDDLLLNFNNDAFYAQFLANYYKEGNEFYKLTVDLLCEQEKRFWLLEATEAFNELIQGLKNETILLKNILSYLPSEKLLWGFSEYMRSATRASLITHEHSLDYISTINRTRKIDEMINDQLKGYVQEF